MTDFSVDAQLYGKDTKISFTKHAAHTLQRRPVAESLGCHLEGAAMPHPSLNDTVEKVVGAGKRVARRTPEPDAAVLRRFRRFVRSWCNKNLLPLPPEKDLSFESWLPKTNYNEARKQELRDAYEQTCGLLRRKHTKVKTFIKDEFYPEFKYVRAIMARTDAFKCFAGPVFKAIEESLFHQPQFVKYVAVDKRPAYIHERLFAEGAKYVATDYTAYESHFTAELMRSCEFILYNYMLSNHYQRFLHNKVLGVLLGKNVIEYRDVLFTLIAMRMSGEMNTSLGNGFSNYMFMMFICQERGLKAVGVVEGDDGLFRISGGLPTAEDFALLGLTIKIEVHTQLHKAAFCKIIYDPEDKAPVTSPFEVLAKFGWSKSHDVGARPRRKKMLLLAKAMSYKAQFPGCPVVEALADYVLRVVKDITYEQLREFVLENGSYDTYERERLLWAIDKKPHERPRCIGLGTRTLVEEVYGLSIEMQLKWESYLDSLNRLQPIRVDTFFLPKIWVAYFEYYSKYTVDKTVSFDLVGFSLRDWLEAQEVEIHINARVRRMLARRGLFGFGRHAD